MLRRKLTSFTIMYTAGIAAGFFMLESLRTAESIGFMTALSIAVLFAGGDINRKRRAKLIMIAVMMCGFLSFTFRYMLFEHELSKYAGTETRIRCRVISSSVNDKRLSLIVKCGWRYGGPGLMQLAVYDYSSHPATDMTGDKLYEEGYELTGAVIEAGGEFRGVMASDNPGCFDYRRYLRARGIAVWFKANGIDVIDEGSSPSAKFRRYLFRTREAFIDSFDEETAGFIRGVVFGDKRDISSELTREFNINSTGHILAVSGLHMGFLYSLLRLLSGRRRTKTASLGIIAVMIIYGEMTLWSPATIRACIVMSISILAIHFKRPFDLLTSVSLAALIILIWQPYQLFDTGFELSFLAMSGIALLTRPVSSLTGEAMGVLISVQLGTIPLTAYTFYRINPLAVFINVPVILMASLLVPVCILMLMAGTLTGRFPGAGIWTAELLAYAVMKVNRLLMMDGSFSYRIAGLGAAVTITVYIVLFGLSTEWTRVRLLRNEGREIAMTAALILMPLMMAGACLYDSFADDEVVFVAVGQGDCTHIRAGGHHVLIDGGGQDDFNVGERILTPYLLHAGAGAVDMALVTHLHMDHYKGITELAEDFPVGRIGIPSDYRGGSEMIDKAYYIEPGTRIRITDDVYIDSVWPVRESSAPVSADDPNEHNNVYIVYYKGIRLMITGDLLESDEADMLKYYDGTEVLKCDILKVAHHGSKSSSSEAFLDAAAPDIAVIQVGPGNFYGHPHAQTIERLEARGIRIYRTDLDGAVGIDIRKDRINVDTFRQRRTDGL